MGTIAYHIVIIYDRRWGVQIGRAAIKEEFVHTKVILVVFIEVYNIMKIKSGKASNLYLQISLFVNFIIIVGIVVYILKRKNISPISTPFASAKTSRILKH